MTAEGPFPAPRLPDASAGLPELSIVIPVLDEAGNIAGVLNELTDALDGRFDFDIVVVDDGSKDQTATVVADCARQIPALRLVRHAKRAGQSAALRSGARIAHADWLIIMDGDGQYDPSDIHRLTAALVAVQEPLPALVFGIRSQRHDTIGRHIASRFANGLRRWMLRDRCSDTGCGLKLINRDVFLCLPYFAALHRFLPALVQGHGYPVIGIPVGHRPRLKGISKYTNTGRAVVGLFDLFGAMWLIRRTPTPQARTEDLIAAGQEEQSERNRVSVS